MVVPTLTTLSATLIESTRANSGGNISSNGGKTITERGICWNTSGTPTTSDSKTSDAVSTIGVYILRATGLSPSTTYYIRAYAINSDGTGYGDQVSFITSENIASVLNNVDICYTDNTVMTSENIASVLNNVDICYTDNTVCCESPELNGIDISFGKPVYIEPVHPILENIDISFNRPEYNGNNPGTGIFIFGGI